MGGSQGIVGVLAIIAGIYIVAIWVPRRLRRRRANSLARQEAAVSSHQRQNSVEKSIVELHEIGRSLSANLETKIAILKELLDQVDERIEYFEKLTQDLPQKNIEKKIDSKILIPKQAANESRKQKLFSRHSEIFELSQQGLSNNEIAQKIGLPVGEINLILDLHAQGNTDS